MFYYDGERLILNKNVIWDNAIQERLSLFFDRPTHT